MEELFLKILNMSITSVYAIAAVLLIRLLLKKAPKKYSYFLWSVVGFRLCCPISFSSVISIFSIGAFNMTAAQSGGDAALRFIPPDIGYMTTPEISVGIPVANAMLSQSLPAAAEAASVNPLQIWIATGTILWCAGIAAILIYSLVTYYRLKGRLATAVPMEENILESDKICSPFVLGVIKPKIYIPFGLGERERDYILRHEACHLKRKDHLARLLGFLVLAVHWFNPLVWIAFAQMSKDMEMSCDEEVLSQTGEQIRKDYSMSLLSFASNRRFPVANPLAFGETGVRQRVKNVLNFKKPGTWVTIIAALLCLAVVITCAANPLKRGGRPPEIHELYGSYAFEKNVYTNPLSSFFSNKDNMPIFTIWEGGLLFTERDGSRKRVPAVYEGGEVDEEAFNSAFFMEFGVPDISKYKTRYQYTLNESSFPNPRYRLYWMDGEVWLATLNSEKIHSIYELKKTGDLSFGEYANLGIAVPLPEEYEGKVGLTQVDKLPGNVIIEAYHLASREAYPESGLGLLFRIVRHTPAEFEKYWVGRENIGGASHFARDNSFYYSYEFATDVQSAEGYHGEYADLFAQLAKDIIPAIIEQNALEPYDHSAVTQAQYTYPGRHLTATFVLSDGTEAWMILSQPVRQGEGGIWCAERWFDENGNRYFILPETDMTAQQYYDQLQKECDNTSRPELLDPEQVALEYIVGVLGQWTARDSVKITATLDNTASYDKTNLDAAVSAAILSENASYYRKGDFAAGSHVVLKTAETGNTATVYTMVLYLEFGFAGGGFQKIGGSHMPVAITFEKDLAGRYELSEYWQPMDGAYYASSIKEKFPADIYADAIDTQKYILAQTQACYAQAIEYGKLDTAAVLEKLVETICSSPAASSRPGDYIDAHPIEYRELLNYGDYTLRYVFTEFLKGGQTGLAGHIMLAAMRELLGPEDMGLMADTAQQWFDEWKNHAVQLQKSNTEEFVKKNNPKAFLLLQMLKEAQ